MAFIEISETGLNPSDFELKIELNDSCCASTKDGKKTLVVNHNAPGYPPAAKAVSAQGEVVVAVKIGSDGKVVSAVAEMSHPLLKKAAENAVKTWQFSDDPAGPEREGRVVVAFCISDKEYKPGRFRENGSLEVTSEISWIH